mmetsp:Transcript_25454/g.35239  ORF Transcript_25454/g.35239 Transcript_25454/m.35239 type:complete len:1039 (-) Transcript_25454:237-3353(-)|eukprot:CAMPEP_0201478852 /NCGR_PEP_ID=MMETSP0151_2-20130828/3610_1 /ASSEMBLY_ACC=CAM_ASM_000257 /TAXON_ID=200890 /ORGANISM="Paramoeba atlantica, Strain 621/1 / CCAP 1560/9" /LENGTH=1038 /DNA_ID=CAMNT_0047860073 /DNA_START=152 /DNA_END=3268 /DNA_ORIENTATION=+
MADDEGAHDLSGDETEKDDFSPHTLRHLQFYDGSHEIVIDNFMKKHHDAKVDRTKVKLMSDEFEIDGFKWRVIYFPNGNNNPYLSLFLEARDIVEKERHTAFRIVLKNQGDKEDVSLDATHQFTRKVVDWGFNQALCFKELLDERLHWLKDDKITLVVETKVNKQSTDRYETGFIGIKNQGATCYMNSLLQALFHLKFFRRVVYKMPTETGKISIPFALQCLFYRLQTSEIPVSTKELTKSFGWDTADSFSQHDVTEFNRVLIDTLETKMKGTPVEGTMQKLFRGRFINYIRCVHVDFESTRPEYFYDLQMPIEHCSNIYQSFEKYMMPERMEGENKYQAEGHGLQDADRGVRFDSFPDVLELNLNRFKQDFYTGGIQKVNDLFEFYPVIDLSKFVPSSGQSNIFHLHAVLVHSGTMHGGHYYVYIRPGLGPEWYRFDDSIVKKASEKDAIDDNFGVDERMRHPAHNHPMIFRKFSNAYMLIYVRDSCVKTIFEDVPDDNIPRHLIDKIEEEQREKERRRKEEEEARLSMDVMVVTDELLQSGTRDNFDMIDFADVPKIRVRKDTRLIDFLRQYSRENQLTPDHIRFWNWISRKNKTTRVQKPFKQQDLEQPMEDLDRKGSGLRIYAEISTRQEKPYFDEFLFGENKKPITGIIFFKFFDLQNQKLFHIGHVVVPRTSVVCDIIPSAKKFHNVPEDTDVVVYEEVRKERIDAVEPNQTLNDAELVSGDILVIEKKYTEEELDLFPVKSCNGHYNYLLNKITVSFHKLKEPEKEDFTLELSKLMTYDDLAKRVGVRLGVDPQKVRLTVECAVKDRGYADLDDFKRYFSVYKIVFYEILDMTLAEFIMKKKVTIHWLNSDVTIKESFPFLVNRRGLAQEIFAFLEEKIKLTGTKKIRLYRSMSGSVDVVQPHIHIEALAGGKLYAYEILQEDLELPSGTLLLKVLHMEKSQFHGIPFFFPVKKGETGDEVMAKMRVRLKIHEKEFQTYRLAYKAKKFYFCPEDEPLDLNIEFLVLYHPRKISVPSSGPALTFKELKEDEK